MTDPAQPVSATAPTEAIAAPAKAPNAPARELTFYFSPSHKASFHPGRSISLFKGQEFTEVCAKGTAPTPRKDLVTLGTGTDADVTTRAPA